MKTNKIIKSYRLKRYPTIQLNEFDNKAFSVVKTVLKDKNRGWSDKSNIDRINILSFFTGELMLYYEVLDKQQSINPISFENKGDKVIITKKYIKDNKEEKKTYELSFEEYLIIKNIIKKVIYDDIEIYEPKTTKTTTNKATSDDTDEGFIDDSIPF